MTVLIVDDDGDDRDLFCQALMEVRPEAICIMTTNGEEMFQYLNGTAATPDYIFLDVYMGRLDGKDCLLRIRSMKDKMRIPVIMYSAALKDENERDAYRKLGASSFMTKPNSYQELKNLLSTLFNNGLPR